MLKKQIGFTLAEVLITLSIIGVVAALTIPNLVKKYQEMQTVSMLKKEFSVLSQAYNMAVIDNGTPEGWSTGASYSQTGANDYVKILAPYLKVTKNCTTSGSGCLPDSGYKYLTGASDSGFVDSLTWGAKADLADGTVLVVDLWSASCSSVEGSSLALSNVCAEVIFDINGKKSPNQWGNDLFAFLITKYGVVPVGTAQETVGSSRNFSTCNTSGSGVSCAGWVIYNENMDYLHCSNLAWDGNKTCQ